MFEELAKQETNQFARQGWRWKFSRSPQCIQMLWAAKAGGQKRPCHDYRAINQWMKDDQGPLPSIEAMITDLAGARYLTSMDLPKAYHEIRIAEGGVTTADGQHVTYEEILAFQCGDELYQPTVVQFGSKTAVSHFQRYMNHVLRSVWGKSHSRHYWVYAYLDNIAIGAMTREHLEQGEREVLRLLKEADLRIEPTKSEWGKTTIHFCGFMIGHGKITTDPEKIRAIKEWTIPWHDEIPEGEKKTAIREFHGFCNFYRNTIPRFSDMAGPLTTLAAPNTEWKVTPTHMLAFAALKNELLKQMELAAFNENATKHVHADAATLGSISGCVSQEDENGKLVPLGFYSKKLTPTEQRYTVTEQELMAITKTFEHFRHWLHGPMTVQVHSDHAALKNLLTMQLTPRNARWIQSLGEYNLIIQHIPGRENRAADALSRVGSHGHGVASTAFDRPDWFGPSGVSANEALGTNHKRLARNLIEPIAEKDERTRAAWEKHKKEQSARTLEVLVSSLILSSNVHS